MFGFVTANIVDLSDDEKARYQAMYCGLCRSLKELHGQRSRLCLSYDLTFLIMLLGSLYEPEETESFARCPAHPVTAQRIIQTHHTAYAADMAVALAYYKCLDDWNDEGKKTARGMNRLLEKAYRDATRRWPRQCAAIDAGMAATTAAERDMSIGPDAAAQRFGEIIGTLFAFDEDDYWAPALWRLGAELGRFIYFMDAAVDLEDDIAHDTYNPFVALGMDRDAAEPVLMSLIGGAAEIFETLPLERDLHAMRSVIYAGVWQQFYAKRTSKPLGANNALETKGGCDAEPETTNRTASAMKESR